VSNSEESGDRIFLSWSPFSYLCQPSPENSLEDSQEHTSKDMNSLFTPEGSGSQQHLTNKRATVVVMFHQIFLEI
jgi:hypothetical protein